MTHTIVHRAASNALKPTAYTDHIDRLPKATMIMQSSKFAPGAVKQLLARAPICYFT